MSAPAVVLGLVLAAVVAAALATAPRISDVSPWLLRLGSGQRRWWLLWLAIAVPVWVGLGAASSTSPAGAYVVLLALAALLLPGLAALWALARARSSS